MKDIFPHALALAAKTFADRPKVLGEILVELCGVGRKLALSDVQQYIVAECREEIAEREAIREYNRIKKAKSRAKAKEAK